MLNIPEIKSGLQFVLAFIENIELTQKIEKLGHFIELGQVCCIYTTKKEQIKAIPIGVKETENGYVLILKVSVETMDGARIETREETRELPISDFSHITPVLEDLHEDFGLNTSPFIRKKGFNLYDCLGEKIMLNAPTLGINTDCKLIDFDMDGRVVVEIEGNLNLIRGDYKIQLIERNEKA